MTGAVGRAVLLLAMTAGCGAPHLDCHALGQSAAATDVAGTALAQTAPAGVGGALVDGLYVRTATTLYTGVDGAEGPEGDTHRQTLEVSGEGTALKSVDSKNGGADALLVFGVRTEGNQLETSLGCGQLADTRSAYSATADTLTVVDPTGTVGGTRVLTFTRQ